MRAIIDLSNFTKEELKKLKVIENSSFTIDAERQELQIFEIDEFVDSVFENLLNSLADKKN